MVVVMPTANRWFSLLRTTALPSSIRPPALRRRPTRRRLTRRRSTLRFTLLQCLLQCLLLLLLRQTPTSRCLLLLPGRRPRRLTSSLHRIPPPPAMVPTATRLPAMATIAHLAPAMFLPATATSALLVLSHLLAPPRFLLLLPRDAHRWRRLLSTSLLVVRVVLAVPRRLRKPVTVATTRRRLLLLPPAVNLRLLCRRLLRPVRPPQPAETPLRLVMERTVPRAPTL